jgi:acetate kinase
MKILVANLGSTSFKYRLFDMDGEGASMLAEGGFERVTDYANCIESMLETLQSGEHLASKEDIEAVGFKTVLGKDLSGCVEADDRVLEALEGFKEVAPAHNPAYAEGIRCFRDALPNARRVALFETAFYQWVDPAAREYAIPRSWRDIGIRRYGFHGASHKYVAERSAELLAEEALAERTRRLYVDGPGDWKGPSLKVISCHLGGSSSVAGIQDGVAMGVSMGFSPQGGLPQNNRVGDLDSMAIPYVSKMLGLSIEEVEKQLTTQSGLLGLSGVSNDIRDINQAAANGNVDAKFAIDFLVESIRHWAGSFFFKMGGADALCFTAGIGENNAEVRAKVCTGLEGFGLKLDPERNASLKGGTEGIISTDDSTFKAIVIPANEELVVAREVYRKLKDEGGRMNAESA